MPFLYTSGIVLYGLLIRVFALFNPKAKQWVAGRKALFPQLPSTNHREVVWFHCASLGEFDQGLPLMHLIKKERPNIFLLVTFFSPSGYNHYHKREHPADYVCYIPLDLPGNARRFVAHFRPSTAIFVKYEFWINHLRALHSINAKTYVISGLFRDSHRFFKWYGGFFRNALRNIDHFFVQNEKSRQLLHNIKIDQVSVTGDNRFDRVMETKQRAVPNKLLEQFKGEGAVFIAGSTWPADETILIPWANTYSQKIIIAPHQVDEKHIREIERKIRRKAVRYTQATMDSIHEYDILILDTIGHLASAYVYGNMAYVGGGFSGSLHNILEPAVFGLPVIFGPKHHRFPEAQAFIDGGFGFSIRDTQDLENAVSDIASNYRMISLREQEFVAYNAGASLKIWKQLNKHLTSSSPAL